MTGSAMTGPMTGSRQSRLDRDVAMTDEGIA
jgi:hypothetical protein